VATVSRRVFINALCLSSLFGRVEAKRDIPIALQLFSVREECQKDLRATLAAVRDFGYEGVEFAGFYGWTAGEVRKLLDAVSLAPCGSHTPLDQLLGATFDKTVEFNRAMGNRNLIVPGLPSEYHSPAGWAKAARLFNELSERLERIGMRLGYHNHSIEFQRDGDQLPWDIFFGGTRSEVTMQLDLGNARIAGADPISLLKRYPGRARSIHVKDYLPGKPDVMLGSSDFDWRALFRICEATGGTEWYIIEHESRDAPALDAAKESLGRFRRLRGQGSR